MIKYSLYSHLECEFIAYSLGFQDQNILIFLLTLPWLQTASQFFPQSPWFLKLTWNFLLVSSGFWGVCSPHPATHSLFLISFLFTQHFASCLLSTSHIYIFWPLVILYLISVHLHSPSGRQYRIMLDEKSLRQWAWNGIWVLNICQAGYFLNYNFRAQSIKPLQLQ